MLRRPALRALLTTRYGSMRLSIHALLLAFTLGGLAPLSAVAGEGCSYGSHAIKKNDVETPPPAAAAAAKTKQQG